MPRPRHTALRKSREALRVLAEAVLFPHRYESPQDAAVVAHRLATAVRRDLKLRGPP